MKTRSRRLSLAAVAAITTMLLPGTAFAAGTVRVNGSDIGSTWFLETLGTGHGEFRTGPASPPLGAGSFEMDTLVENVDKVTLTTSDWSGHLLSELSGLDYWTYRDATSTSPGFVAPSINIAIFTNADGPRTGFATLVFEPLYSYGNAAIEDGVWQHWDTYAASRTAFAGGWWTTRPVGTNCAFACYATIETLQALAPNTTILSVGLNMGRGPASFVGAVDALSLTMAGARTTYDLELLQSDKDGCKKGGWQDFHTSGYKNQGDCVSFFASAKRQGPKAEVTATTVVRRSTRATTPTSRVHAAAPKTHQKPAHAHPLASGTKHKDGPKGR
jgi:hypothetical protein